MANGMPFQNNRIRNWMKIEREREEIERPAISRAIAEWAGGSESFMFVLSGGF